MNTLAEGVLFVANNFYIILITTIVGFVLIDMQKFGRVFMLLLFSLVLNTYLKSIFQVPLPEHLGVKGWAFPSGHTQTAVVFWGGLAWMFKKRWFSISALILLFSAAVAIVYQGYHEPYQVVGAWVVALLLVLFDEKLRNIAWFKNNTLRVGFAYGGGSALMMFHILHITQGAFYADRWLFMGGIIGFAMSCEICHRQGVHRMAQWQKWVSVLIIILGVFLIISFGPMLLGRFSYSYGQFLRGCIVCLWIGWVPVCVKRFSSFRG